VTTGERMTEAPRFAVIFDMDGVLEEITVARLAALARDGR
jgi:hypothetical protein